MNIRELLRRFDIDKELIDYIDIFADLDSYKKIYSVDKDNNCFYDRICIAIKLKDEPFAEISDLYILIPHDEYGEYIVSFILRDRLSNVGMVDNGKPKTYQAINNLYFIFDRKTKNISGYSLLQSLTDISNGRVIVMHNQDRYSAYIVKEEEKRTYNNQWMNEFFDKDELAIAKLISDDNLKDIVLGKQNFINLINDTKLFNDFEFCDETPLTRKLHQ